MIETFGTHPNGDTHERITIGDDLLTVSLLTYGASIQSIKIAGVPFSLCLGFETLEEYLNAGSYFGAVVGRVANRIGNGRADIDGIAHTFDRNEADRHTLHGGAGNIGVLRWKIKNSTSTSAILSLTDPDGTNGFPGNLQITARFEVLPDGCLEISLEAVTDSTTLCNLAPHPYFNLNGSGDAREQVLHVEAVSITETDDENIPTGALKPVFGTPWDHRRSQKMVETGLSYDTNFCLSHAREQLREVARLVGRDSGVTMRIETSEPGLQVYDGAGLRTPYSGIAIEPQCWPDAPNNPHFPSILLRPGSLSRQTTRFHFAQG